MRKCYRYIYIYIPTIVEEEEDEMEDGQIYDSIAQPEGKIGAKKLRKLEEKAEKKARREVIMTHN